MQFQRCRNGNFDLTDLERPGLPKKFGDKELEQLLEENPTQPEKELAHDPRVTEQAILHRLHRLGRIGKQTKKAQN